MDRPSQRRHAETLRRLHHGPEPLLVGSAWDPASAVLFQQAGFAAIATSSAGVAYSLGYPDGERLPWEEMLAAIARIVRAVDIPVSADIEAGYGASPEVVAETCRGVLEAGAVGVNLEDAVGQPPRLEALERQVEKIRAVRQMAEDYGVPLVINARTDGYWLKLGEEPARFEDSVRRATAYRAAGADCLFVPGATDPELIAALVQAIDGPLNVLATPGAPDVAELAQLGVARISQGSGPARAVLAATRRIAQDLKAHGRYDAYTQDTIPYPEANQLFP